MYALSVTFDRTTLTKTVADVARCSGRDRAIYGEPGHTFLALRKHILRSILTPVDTLPAVPMTLQRPFLTFTISISRPR
jgi:hypothetical protein